MTTIVVLLDPPDENQTLASLVPDVLSSEAASQLYGALAQDVCVAIQRGNASLLLNYRPGSSASDQSVVWNTADDGQVPPNEAGQQDNAGNTKVRGRANGGGWARELLAESLPEPDAVRYEPQVGSTHGARIGNALTHLLDTEERDCVAVIEPTVGLLGREHVGTLVMKLRSSEMVVGPTPSGSVYAAGFREPIDFTDAFEPPAIETLTRRGTDAGLTVDFLPMRPLVETSRDLATLLAYSRARRTADRLVPPHTAAVVDSLELDPTGLLGG